MHNLLDSQAHCYLIFYKNLFYLYEFLYIYISICLGDYSILFISPSTNNCFSIIAEMLLNFAVNLLCCWHHSVTIVLSICMEIISQSYFIQLVKALYLYFWKCHPKFSPPPPHSNHNHLVQSDYGEIRYNSQPIKVSLWSLEQLY